MDPWAYLRDVLTRLPTMPNRQVKDSTRCNLGRGPKDETRSRVAISTPPSTCFSRCFG
ncbi:transposase domain-containing protein [Prosthecobacter algae]|uniref:transposase domain-containing protein n=1 Tax=Prosthecobacter algae TaxID=1144682 RepID=UPI0031F0A539